MASDAEHLFICLWVHCMSSLEKCLFRSFAHFFFIPMFVFLEWNCVSFLYILEIKPLQQVSFANMFSHMVGSLFILLLFSLAMQKLFMLIKLFVYSFLYVPFSTGHISEKIATWHIWNFPAYVFLWDFYGVASYSSVFIHLEFIFEYGVNWWLSFIFLHIAVQISQHHLLKRLFLLHFMLLPLLLNINWP